MLPALVKHMYFIPRVQILLTPDHRTHQHHASLPKMKVTVLASDGLALNPLISHDLVQAIYLSKSTLLLL